MGLCPLFVFEGGFTQLIERIRAVAERVARSYNLEIFDMQFRRESVGLDAADFCRRAVRRRRDWPDEAEDAAARTPRRPSRICEHVSRDISAILDVEETIDHSYTLEVSSPDSIGRCGRRPITGDLREGSRKSWSLNRSIGQKHFEGRLGGIEDDAIVIETTPGKRQRIPLSLVTRARLEVEF